MNYITLLEANTYFLTRLSTGAWDDSNNNDREASLTMGTEIIDRLNYRGEKHDDAQVNQFPRGDDIAVPDDIKKACAEIALALLDGVDPELEFANLNMSSQAYANIKSTYDRGRPPEHILAGVPSVSAWRYLKPFLRDPYGVSLNRVS